MIDLKNIKLNDFLVMPRWGVGKCQGWQTVKIDGEKIEVLLIYFYTTKLTMYFPQALLETLQARNVASLDEIKECLAMLKSTKHISRQKWGLAQQNYYQKINSGELFKLIEVIRDTSPTFSKKWKRQNTTQLNVYNAAVDLFVNELMIVQNISYEQAKHLIQFI